MKISKSSWHYKLIKLYESEPANNLCIYFWQVVLALLIPVFVIIVALFIIYFMINATLISIFSVIGSILFIVLFIFYASLPLYDKYIEPFYNKYIKREPKPLKPKKIRKPNLTIEYLKAKKQKICPILEWEE